MKKKLKFFILMLCCIIMFSNISIGTSESNIQISENDEIYRIIEQLREYQDKLLYEDGIKEPGFSSAMANKMKELCNNDINKVKSLTSTYYLSDGTILWDGSNPSAPSYNAVNKAIESIKSGQSQVEISTQNEIDKLGKDILAGMDEIRKMKNDPNVNRDSLLAKLKEIDQKIKDYFTKTGSQDWQMLQFANEIDSLYKQYKYADDEYQTALDKENKEEEERKDSENENEGGYSSGGTGKLGSSNASATHTPDEVIGEAEDFIDSGKNSGLDTLNGENLKKGSSSLYNMLMVVAVFLAVAIGMFLGVKFMLSSAEDKAKVKEALIPYIVGCIIIFSAFTIWKLVIVLLSGVNSVV